MCNRRLHPLLFLVVCILTTVNTLRAQSLGQEIDSLINISFPDSSAPGAVFLVAQNGELKYQQAVGRANMEWALDMTTNSVFQIGSMTKQFTAIAILMLEEQGKLRVSDPVARFLPDFPNGQNITLHHLLTHSSGIRDFTKMKVINDIARQDLTPAALVEVFRREAPDFQPGEKFAYNNSGYVLLGYLIELISGETYADFIEKHLFRKAGMLQSSYASDRTIIPHRALGYHKKGGSFVNKTFISYTIPFSSGALMSTAGDLWKWQEALSGHRLLQPESSAKAFRTYRLNNGDSLAYGYGWHIRTLGGRPSREHGGSIFGYKSMAVYLPEEDIYVVALSNCDCHSPTELARRIAELALKHLQ